MNARSRVCTGVLIGTLSVAACDSSTDGGRCEDDSISPNLKRIMYWGEVEPDHWEPNQGIEAGGIFHPVWYADDSILVHTGKLDHGVDVVGIFNVAIDPATYSFRGVESYAFADVIRDYDYDPPTGDFAITFSKTPSDIQTVSARVAGDSLVAGNTILDASWFPLAARFVSSADEIVAYAHDPSTLINGFYYVSRISPSSDSLLHAIDLSVSDARGFDIAAGTMCFGRTDLAGGGMSTISVINLNGDQTPRIVATLKGAFVSASVHPAGSCAVVSVSDLSEPGSVVGLLDLASGSFTRLDVQTRPCTFATADFASWNPTGDAFSFSAGGFDGEGGEFARQLWGRRSSSCQ